MFSMSGIWQETLLSCVLCATLAERVKCKRTDLHIALCSEDVISQAYN